MSNAVIARLLVAGLLVLYPILVYFGLRVLPPSFFGLLLIVLILPRLIAIKSAQRLFAAPVTIILVYAVAATIAGSTQALLYYPAVVNLVLGTIFAGSLLGPEPLLLRVVRSRGMTLSEHAPFYLRRLTGVWAAFFALNCVVAIWTTTRSMEVWTIYNGFISYLLIAALVGVEWLYRRRFKRLHGVSIS